MGIDVRMFARIQGRDNWLKPEDVLKKSVELSRTFGAGNFLITKGKPVFSSFDQHHALSIVQPLTQEDIKAWELESSMLGCVVHFQDGEPIIADPEEQFVEVHLSQRYYGPGYERGNWPIIRGVAEWLELHLRFAEVWYGGDSSGVLAESFGPGSRQRINNHYLRNGHRPYSQGWASMDRGNKQAQCECCEQPMCACGGGPDRTFWFCDGCDAKAVSTKSTVTLLDHGQDFFTFDKVPTP